MNITAVTMLALALSGVASQSAPTPIGKLTHKGFTVDITPLNGLQNIEMVLTALRQQIDMVAGVKVKPEQRSFFESISIMVTTDAALCGTGLGRYHNQTKTVILCSTVGGGNPLLVRGLLHAYHRQLPETTRNPDVLKFYAEAKAQERLPVRALSDHGEYFANAGTIDIFGRIGRNPGYTREDLKAAQPDAYQWFEKGVRAAVTLKRVARRAERRLRTMTLGERSTGSGLQVAFEFKRSVLFTHSRRAYIQPQMYPARINGFRGLRRWAIAITAMSGRDGMFRKCASPVPLPDCRSAAGLPSRSSQVVRSSTEVRLRPVGATAGQPSHVARPAEAHASAKPRMREGWCARQDSNLRPLAPELNAPSN